MAKRANKCANEQEGEGERENEEAGKMEDRDANSSWHRNWIAMQEKNSFFSH